MARQLTAWNKLVQKQFKAGKANDKNYSFKQALKDASKNQNGGNEQVPSNNEINTDEKHKPNQESLQNGGNDPVGASVGSSTLSGSPLHKGGRRRSKKHRSHHKKRGKSHKNQKHTRHH
jgi:hypothetical protein